MTMERRVTSVEMARGEGIRIVRADSIIKKRLTSSAGMDSAAVLSPAVLVQGIAVFVHRFVAMVNARQANPAVPARQIVVPAILCVATEFVSFQSPALLVR